MGRAMGLVYDITTLNYNNREDDFLVKKIIYL